MFLFLMYVLDSVCLRPVGLHTFVVATFRPTSKLFCDCMYVLNRRVSIHVRYIYIFFYMYVFDRSVSVLRLTDKSRYTLIEFGNVRL